MTDTKLLRHSLDSAASLKPQRQQVLRVRGGGHDPGHPMLMMPFNPHFSLAPNLLSPLQLSLGGTTDNLERRGKCGDAVAV